MYADFISMGYPLIFDQGIIDKCQERMPLAILGKCSLEDTFGRHLPPTIEEYRKIIQSKAVNDDDSTTAPTAAPPADSADPAAPDGFDR